MAGPTRLRMHENDWGYGYATKSYEMALERLREQVAKAHRDHERVCNRRRYWGEHVTWEAGR